jgi:hypothetical protein
MSEKLPIFRTAFAGWREGLAALRRMPGMAAVIFAVMLADTVTDEAFRLATTPATRVPMQLASLVVSVTLLGVVLTPAAIALYRHIMLGETTRRYGLDLSGPRFRKFAAYSALLNLLVVLPVAAAELMTGIYLGVATLVLAMIAVAALVLTSILFPAIAVEAPGASLRNAVRDIRFFRALLISFVTASPLLVAVAVYIAIGLEEGPPNEFLFDWIFNVVFVAAVSTALFAAFTAVSCQFYRAWAVRLKEPAAA